MGTLVSVCMPVYNGQRYLAEAVDSILRQTYPHLELVVQDDHSTDGTPAILASYQDPRLRVERNPCNLGTVRTLNRAIDRAAGKYLRIFCHDDRMLPTDLATMVRFLDAYPEAGMCFSSFRWIDETGHLLRPRARIAEQPGMEPIIASPDLAARLFYKYGCLPGNLSTVMLARQAVNVCGRFDDQFLQLFDWDLWLRTSQQFPIGVLADELCEIRFHPQQYSKYAYQVARIREGYQILQRLDRLLPAEYLAPRDTYRRRIYSLQYIRYAIRALATGKAEPGQQALAEIGRHENLALVLGLYLAHVGRRLVQLLKQRGKEAVPPDL